MSKDISIKCIDCGTEFSISDGEQKFYKSKGFPLPKRCVDCREKNKIQYSEFKRKKSIEEFLNNNQIRNCTIEKNEIITNEKTLFVIGNGFDLAHGVKSSYYNFASTLGKRNSLRNALETYIMTDDLWGDFENNLARINSSAMMNYDVLDLWLDNFDAYEEDSTIGNLYAAIDMAMGPLDVITSELPRRFRMWVESLKVNCNETPFENLIVNSKVLCFNYTEFIENIYHVSRENVCYIHGCRCKEKYRPKEDLILGHIPKNFENEYDDEMEKPPLHLDKGKSEFIDYIAMDIASKRLIWYDEATTKNCKEIIKAHNDFFSNTNKIDMVVVIGHSLSEVDWDYFSEIIKQNRNSKEIKWYISYHSAGDLKRIVTFANVMSISRNNLFVFEI